jgi:hypothetical protein
MARLARAEVFAPDEIAVVHVMNRVVRRCFLMGDDPLTGKNYDHRKQWIEDELRRLAARFGIDLIAHSILSNHFHLVLRSRPDVVAGWDDTSVARRWLQLCPLANRPKQAPDEPTEAELNSIRHDPDKLREIRTRLSDISWWMRLLCQRIAQWANQEEEDEQQQLGKFWQSRYRAVRLLDEAAILACAAYVDLNPIRAALAETLEECEYTSAQLRVQQLASGEQPDTMSTEEESSKPQAEGEGVTPIAQERTQALPRGPGDFLSPVQIPEGPNAEQSPWAAEHGEKPTAQLGAGPSAGGSSTGGRRCSDKGFTSLTAFEYLELLDWTARQVVTGKPGATPEAIPGLLERLELEPQAWCELVSNFGRLFSVVAGKPTTVQAHRGRRRGQRFHLRQAARELLSA